MGPKSRWGGVGSSGDRLCQTSPIPRSPDGDKKSGSRGSEQLIIDEWAVCQEIWSIVPLKKDVYSMAHL